MSRHRVLLLAFVGALVLATVAGAAWTPPGTRAAQDDATPDLGADLPDGIDLQTRASGIAEELPATPAHLRLERLTVEPGPGGELRPAPGPELLYVDTGTVLIADELGLEGAYAAGSQLFLPAGVSYALRNDATEPATLLRLGLIPAAGDASPAAAAAPDATASEVLLAADVTTLPAAPATVFLARVTWEPGADLGRTTLAGPIGLLTQSGTLSVAGPSGIEGQLAEGRSIVLPAGTQSRQRNAGDEPAQVLMIGVIPGGEELTAPIVPTPTATVVPEATSPPEATSTPEPTATTIPEPTPTPLPAAGSVLYEADTAGGLDEWSLSGGWHHFDGMLVNDGGGGAAVAPYQPTGLSNYAIETELQLIDNRDNSHGIFIRDQRVGVYFRPTCCGYWEATLYLDDEEIADTEFEFNPYDWHIYRLEVDGNVASLLIDGDDVVTRMDNRLISGAGGEVGIWCPEGDQINVASFRVIALGDEAASVPSDAASELSAATIVTEAVAIAAMLPAAAEMPLDLVQTEEGARTSAAITATFPDPTDAAQRFAEWDWQENAFRHFAALDGSVVETSLHLFGSEEAAADALSYFADGRAAVLRLQGVPFQGIGDSSTAVGGTVDGGNEYTLYVQQGNVLLRVTAVSPIGDPSADAVAVAELILAKAG